MERKTFGKSSSGDVRRASHTDIGRKSGNAQRHVLQERDQKRLARRERRTDEE